MAVLAQCDEGILKAIEWHNYYKQNKTEMYWILKKIRLASKFPMSCSPNNLEHTLHLTQELINCKQGRTTFANYYWKLTSAVQTIEGEDAVRAFKRITAKAT